MTDKFEESIEFFDRVLVFEPNNKEALYSKGIYVSIKKGDALRMIGNY